MPSSSCRASRPLPPISRCAACWSPRCCTARIAHARIKRIDASPGARIARRGRRAHLAGYPTRGLFHRRAVRPHPRPAGQLLAGQQSALCRRPGGFCRRRDRRDRRTGARADRGRLRAAACPARSGSVDAARRAHPARRAGISSISPTPTRSATWPPTSASISAMWRKALPKPITSLKTITTSPRCSRRTSSRMSSSPTGMKMTAW